MDNKYIQNLEGNPLGNWAHGMLKMQRDNIKIRLTLYHTTFKYFPTGCMRNVQIKLLVIGTVKWVGHGAYVTYMKL
jgi:hypothetical protein